MATATAGMVLHEKVELRKFEGDDTSGPCLETLIVEDGIVQSTCVHYWQTLPETVAFESKRVCVECGEEFGINATNKRRA